MKRFWFGAAASAFLASAPAWLPAQDEALFERLDANKDGQVAADEVDDERRRLFERLLRNGDKNNDGKLSKEEFAAALKPQPAESAPAGGRPEGAANFPAPREIFARFDKNNDGKLSKEEAPERMQENFDRIDANKDGQIEQDELRQAFAAMARRGGPEGTPGQPNPAGRMTPEMVERLFREGDKNGDGKLSVDEIPEPRRELFSRIIARMDDDGDKAITKEQFAKAFEALRGAAGDRRPGAEAKPEGRPEGKPEARPEGGRPQLVATGAPAFFMALDANRDGELSKEEIDNAATALRTLDKNGDGRITRDEVAPRRPQ